MNPFCVLSVALIVYLSGVFTRDSLHLLVGEEVGLTLDLHLLRHCKPGEQAFKNEGGGAELKSFGGDRGALTLERGMGMCRGHDPLFSGQSPLPSPPVYRQSAALVPPVFNF